MSRLPRGVPTLLSTFDKENNDRQRNKNVSKPSSVDAAKKFSSKDLEREDRKKISGSNARYQNKYSSSILHQRRLGVRLDNNDGVAYRARGTLQPEKDPIDAAGRREAVVITTNNRSSGCVLSPDEIGISKRDDSDHGSRSSFKRQNKAAYAFPPLPLTSTKTSASTYSKSGEENISKNTNETRQEKQHHDHDSAVVTQYQSQSTPQRTLESLSHGGSETKQTPHSNYQIKRSRDIVHSSPSLSIAERTMNSKSRESTVKKSSRKYLSDHSNQQQESAAENLDKADNNGELKKKSVVFAASVKDDAPSARKPFSRASSRYAAGSLGTGTKLRKLNLGGAARRVTNSVPSDDEEEENNDMAANSQKEKKSLERNENTSSDSEEMVINMEKNGPSKNKMPMKMDLAYMLNWDPEEHLRKLKGDSGEIHSEGSNNKPKDDAEKNKSKDVIKENEKEDKHHRSSEKELSTKRELKTEAENFDLKRRKVLDNPSKKSDKGIHPDFAALVKPKNMITVNGNDYAKLGVIGMGGSCKVYRALSSSFQVIAIKKVKLEGKDEKQIELFANEINLLKKMAGNPAIIEMYDSEVDLSREAIFVVMEIGEVDLNYVLQQQQQLNKSTSLSINFVRLTWQQMLAAVHSIHEARIVHGDLKPANFLFVRGALKLIDFGIAKAIQSNDTTNIYRDSQIGTLNYMAPEAITGTHDEDGSMKMKLGRASDIWSLGCILYQLIYGKTPFADLRMIQKLQAITNPSYRIRYPEADEAAIDAIQLCLKRKPEARPPIVGKNGLLNEHWFLHSKTRRESP